MHIHVSCLIKSSNIECWRGPQFHRAADETNSPVESLDFQKFKAFLQKYTHFWVSELYILEQLFTTVSVKVVDIHPHFVE